MGAACTQRHELGAEFRVPARGRDPERVAGGAEPLGQQLGRDQVPLWREGRYIRVPLRIEAVREAFPHQMVLEPGPPA